MNKHTSIKSKKAKGTNLMRAAAPFYSLSPGGQIEIPEVTVPPVPNRIVVRELTVDESSPIGPIMFKQPDKSHPCGDPADITQMINRLLAGPYNHNPDAQRYVKPLDLNLGVSTCFIIRLDPSFNWRFSSKLRGVMLGPVKVGDENYYSNLRHVLDDGTESPNPFASQSCRMIYFIGEAIPAGLPHPFNLNIEFVYGIDNTVPIVIDPDIRHPGGSAD
jgi:hypothetical protein